MGERRRRRFTCFYRTLLILPVLALIIYTFAPSLEEALLYHKRPYVTNYDQVENQFEKLLGQRNYKLERLSFLNSGLEQKAFLVLPESSARIWLMYGGNAMLALDFAQFIVDLIGMADLKTDAFLLMDFPGYGGSTLVTNEKNTLEGSMSALKAVEDKLGKKLELNVMGHSLGCAAVLKTASQLPTSRIILSAPFISVVDMTFAIFPFLEWLSRPVVGTLITHKWDNIKALTEALDHIAGPPNGRVDVVHDYGDFIVPFSHGEALVEHGKQLGKCPVELHTIYKSDHNSILYDALPTFAKLFNGKFAPPVPKPVLPVPFQAEDQEDRSSL